MSETISVSEQFSKPRTDEEATDSDVTLTNHNSDDLSMLETVIKTNSQKRSSRETSGKERSGAGKRSTRWRPLSAVVGKSSADRHNQNKMTYKASASTSDRRQRSHSRHRSSSKHATNSTPREREEKQTTEVIVSKKHRYKPGGVPLREIRKAPAPRLSVDMPHSRPSSAASSVVSTFTLTKH